MKVRAQIAMVLNLDKCIGCHTCSVTCKNVWTNREGMEYAWFNNVETKPGIDTSTVIDCPMRGMLYVATKRPPWSTTSLPDSPL